MDKFVYSFNEGSKDMRDLLGGKGANLAEMTRIGLPVPFGFTVTTEACDKYYENENTIPKEIVSEIFEKLIELEEVMNRGFGDVSNPLLVSVRSGSVYSMPGMMDTVLNLGLNDEITEGLARITGNERFAYDSYRKFIQMYGDIVLQIPKEKFDIISEEKDTDEDKVLSICDIKEIIAAYKKLVLEETGKGFPQDPKEQLLEAIMAVFDSWNNDRAILYRKLNNLPNEAGTAVNIQAMVFGNMGITSGSGVAFTRNPSTGEDKLFGEFLVNSQGEDVVAGIRTPQPIIEMKESFPEIYDNLKKIAKILEQHYRDMQDIEFTVENGRLYILQTRIGKRTATAAINIAVDMEEEGLIDRTTAVMRIEPMQIDQLLHPTFDVTERDQAIRIAKGLAASPGAACGKICFSTVDAVTAAANGESVILVRQETSPRDLAGMVAAQGILTVRGGMTSHAAVVARSIGKCCVSGCARIEINEEELYLETAGKRFAEGDYISLDGSTGLVYEGQIQTVEPQLSGNFRTIMEWADEIKTLKVKANADNPRDAKVALEFGAEGIGLCRTEHMFFDEERIAAVRKIVLADTEEERKEAVEYLLPYQKEDFKNLYEVMGELPITIRLIDPPLYDFFPRSRSELHAIARRMDIPFKKINERIMELDEFNPAMGHRGCRIAVIYPEIAEMQAEAIIMAAIEIKKEKDIDVVPEIMIPLVSISEEFAFVKKIVSETAERCFAREGITVEYVVGAMIEIPRAAVTADEIARDAEFFSFGTGDLTQMTFGFSRDDTSALIKDYRQLNIYQQDPFRKIDRKGVGKLIKIAYELGKSVRPNLKTGICGEHAGDPDSIKFCHELGMNYVSCSPFRVPVARIAAAQAAVNSNNR